MEKFITAFLQFIKDNGPIISLLTFFTGLILGNWLSVGRDKRKEFNVAADVLDKILTDERYSPRPNSAIDFYPFRRVLSKGDLVRFDKCVEEYEKAKTDAPRFYSQDCGGLAVVGCFYQDSTPIIAVIDKLLKFTKRK